MDMEKNMVPELTLEPDLGPELVAADAEEKAVSETAQPGLDEAMLSEAERRAVSDFAEKLDISDSKMVLQYGAAAQKHVAAFSESALASVRTKDLGEIGDTLSSLVNELKGVDMSEQKRGFFRRARDRVENLKTQYNKAEVNVNKICEILEKHQVTLLKDIAMLDQMYDLNLTGPIGLVIGNEGEGVGRLVKENCDFVAGIPMKGQINSLNASVAAGVLAYEIVRQRISQK